MPVIKSDINKFTKIDHNGRLRSYVEFNCEICNNNTIQRSDEYRRKGKLCKKCKIKNNSDKELKTKDLELVCASNLLSHLKIRYSKKGLTSNLNPKEVLELVKKNCHYCNSGLSNQIIYKQVHFQYTFNYNGIDRINSNLGYIRGNVVPCCKKCNLAKSDMTYIEFYEHISKIYKNMKNANIQMQK